MLIIVSKALSSFLMGSELNMGFWISLKHHMIASINLFRGSASKQAFNVFATSL